MSGRKFFIMGVFILGMPCTVTLRANECTPPSSGPDAVVMDLTGGNYWGTSNGLSAFSLGSALLNKGDAPLPWQVGIAQNTYRLKNNRFEQIGMSWVKVVGGATTDSTYCACIPSGNSSILGIGCSDVYDASFNGIQSIMGPRSTVDAFAGTLPTLGGAVSSFLERRIQMQQTDLDPEFNEGAKYVGEIQLVCPPDTIAGNFINNNSYERGIVAFNSMHGVWLFGTTGSTARGQPAIQAWKEDDPRVTIISIDIPAEGRLYLGVLVSENGNGTWHFEYALLNFNSHRSARSFSIPVLSGIAITNIGFHDVDYHSGEPYDGTDWVGIHNNGALTWSTDTFAVNENANALRWGTLYNFRFDADAPPGVSDASVVLFRPGTPSSITVPVSVPVILVPTISSLGLFVGAALTVLAGSILIIARG